MQIFNSFQELQAGQSGGTRSTVGTLNRSERTDLNERADKIIQELVGCESELRRLMGTSNKYKVPEIYAGFTSLSNAINEIHDALEKHDW